MLMDANGLKFWLVTATQAWQSAKKTVPLNLTLDRLEHLRLMSRRAIEVPETTPAMITQAEEQLKKVPQTLDRYGTWAYWNQGTGTVRATGVQPDALTILTPAISGDATDLAIGYDGILYLAIAGQLLLNDRRERWTDATLTAANFTIWRIAPDPTGGLWVLNNQDKDGRSQLGRVLGMPLAPAVVSILPVAEPDREDHFCPCEPNPNPPRLRVITTAAIPADERPVAIACSPTGRLALLLWKADQTLLRLLTEAETWSSSILLNQAAYPYSLAWTAPNRIALLQPSLSREALVYELPDDSVAALDPVGDFYALRQFTGEPFCHTLVTPAYYPAAVPTPLIPLTLPAYARQSTVLLEQPIDSLNAATVWHRLYLEAVVPQGCGILVELAATAERTPPTQWHRHRVGDVPGEDPVAAWVPQASEVPFHAGLLNCSPERQRAGLFTVLIQKSNRAVRSLQGRYLWVQISLLGNGHATPEFAALRAYGSRFSYLHEYLPELYHETAFGPDAADQVGASTPADFLERWLNNFEGILTPLEDQIAYSDLLSDPRTTPEEALEWLGSWIGVTFDPAYPMERRRQQLQHAPQLFRQRGTLAGLKLALDLATGGSVSDGEIIVIEDFRLRRTFATILGANLADTTDPLLAGLAISGNAYVGDTLIMGDETKREFLALFSADLDVTDSETTAISSLFEDSAHRVTLFIHNDIDPQDLGLIRRIVEQETPAHVITTLALASYPLLVGVASLVGIDTYLRPKRPATAVRVNRSYVGLNDVIQSSASLDPRIEGERSPPSITRPIAQIDPVPIVELGQSFTLNAVNSKAANGRQIVRYIWTRLN
jgi:phage tail-like protein